MSARDAQSTSGMSTSPDQSLLLNTCQTDMSRAEELSTQFRTLSYDHERLMGMHRTSIETALNAEREASMHKSRLA